MDKFAGPQRGLEMAVTAKDAHEERYPETSGVEVSVIIAAKDAGATIGEQLAALVAQDYDGDWELIVADNGSTDDTRGTVARWAGRIPRLKIVDASAHPGANYAKSLAASVAEGVIVMCCDADDVVAPGWMATMADAAREAGIVGGRLDDHHLNEAPMTSLGLNLTQDGLPVAHGFLPYAMGGNFAIRCEVLDDLGGWDSTYVKGGGDVNLSWRAQLKGLEIRYEPAAVVYVRHRGTLKTLARQRYWYGVGSARLYRDFRAHGMPRDNVVRGIRAWRWLVLRVPHLLRGPEKRGMWVRDAAYSLGLLVGYVRFRLWKNGL